MDNDNAKEAVQRQLMTEMKREEDCLHSQQWV